jgi:hypothetical protein
LTPFEFEDFQRQVTQVLEGKLTCAPCPPKWRFSKICSILFLLTAFAQIQRKLEMFFV